ncbi:hypothetical protein DPMN_101435 [Dreissena polymorpha]|uniref:G-protein coupled receptors family 1 profile domain-containing protein n=1 Tax=Dreissena polymorpha TaxID=45954 RepID=A0A9D4LJ39_DREPO|nr:hypothetical protein DPMN_101435 [Dreissena polymorpha]
MHKSTANQLLVYLSVTDWIASLVSATTITYDLYQVRFTSDVACKLMIFCNVCAISCSLAMVFIVTIDRFLTVYEPFPTWKFTPFHCKLFTAGLFAFTCGSSIPDFLVAGVEEVNVQIIEANVTLKGHNCGIPDTGEFFWLSKVFYIVKIVDFALIFTCFVVMYYLIARKVYKSKQNMLKHHINEHSNKALNINTRNKTLDDSHKSVNGTNASFESNQMQNLATPEATLKDIRQETAVKQRKRNTINDINLNITLMIFLMAITSIVSMMPYCLINYVSRLKRYESPWWIILFSNTSAINSSVNPFIIGFCNSEFRIYVKNVLRCRSVK